MENFYKNIQQSMLNKVIKVSRNQRNYQDLQKKCKIN